jgi:hypothetical protein
MITYFYWGLVIALVVAVILVIGVKMGSIRAGLATAATVLFVGWAAYNFYLEQVFVKRWGGVMTISVPNGQYHIATTWKEDNLWVENYDPETNRCVFTEYSKGNLLEGRVTIKDCNPLMFMVGKGAPALPPPRSAPGPGQAGAGEGPAGTGSAAGQ